MKDPMKVYSVRLLVLYAWICTCNYSYSDAAIIGRTATIFGFGATRTEDSNQQQQQQYPSGLSFSKQPPYPPPPKGIASIPPPPPPPKFSDSTSDALDLNSGDSLGNQTQIADDATIYPGLQQHQQHSNLATESHAENVQLHHPNLPSSPQSGRVPFNQQIRRNGPGHPLQPPGYIIQGMQHDLEVAFQREQGLRAHLSNLTTQLAHMQQREDLHVRQLDVLTERVIETEAAMAEERNELLQYRNNCTEMGKQIALLEGSVEEWRQKCKEHVEQVAILRNESATLGTQLQRMTLKAEDLATLVERHRIAESDDDEIATASHQRRKSTRKRGFFAWFFGWGTSVNHVDESLEALREDARSTLIAALQRERENVEELETAVTILQRNNTALAEQVRSRDDIIEELNDRVGVFEEDRVVLKAALRQLKKDMSEEAPKAQNMANELKAAKLEIDRLRNEIESLLDCHEKEIAKLQSTIQDKQEAIQMTESNLTMIGTYVRKLEERLGDFAVARREIEMREQKCLEIENEAEESNRARKMLEDEVVALQEEHQDFRELIEDLIQARSRLKLESDQLRNERDILKQKQSRLEDNVQDLTGKIASLQNENNLLTSRYFSLEKEYNTTRGSLIEVQEQAISNDDFAILLDKMKLLEGSKENLEAEILRLQEEKQTSSHEAQSALSALESKEEELTELRNNLNNLKQKIDSELESSQQNIQRTAILLAQAEEKAARLEEELNNSRMNEEKLLKRVEAVQEYSRKEINNENNEEPEQMVPSLVSKDVNGSQETGFEEGSTAPKNSTNLPTIDTETKKLEKSQLERVTILPKRQIPLRSLRKTFSKLTGVHGFITKPSRPSGRNLTRNESARSQNDSQLSARQSSPNHSLQSLYNATNTSSTSGKWPASVPRNMPYFSTTNVTRVQSSTVNERKIPLRKLRKFSSKITGVHGLFSRPSRPRQLSKKTSIPRKPQTSTEKRLPPTLNGKAPNVETRSSMPVSLRPEALKHSVESSRQPPATHDPK